MTEFKNFIVKNEDRNDKIGDICSDLLRDEGFTCLNNEEKQKSYIVHVGTENHVTRQAIMALFKEYSGETIPDFDC